MLTKEQNHLLTRVGPETPLGAVMRRYWVPALLSVELPEPDCAPVRVRLLGERLVAFRDTDGQAGLVDEFCPHRGASLWLGRNEERGLRCVYHGWKFDASGRCVDQMNEPVSFAAKVRLQAYPTIERGGIVWAYLGPPDQVPAPPDFAWTRMSSSHRHVNKTWEECNWLQALEGGIDTSHVPILHRVLRDDAGAPGVRPSQALVRGSGPRLEVETTDYGYRYFGVREFADGSVYARGYHFVMPFTQVRPGADFTGGDLVAGHYYVPMDDENTMVYNWEYSADGTPMGDPEMVAKQLGTGPGEMTPDFRKVRNRDNDWLIDRAAQRTESYTGIFGVNTQDHAVQESMDPIYDRTKEQLGPADRAIIVARRLLLRAIQTVQVGGDPPGLDGSYRCVRALDRVFPGDVDWRSEMLAAMQGIGYSQ